MVKRMKKMVEEREIKWMKERMLNVFVKICGKNRLVPPLGIFVMLLNQKRQKWVG